mmetsp:Transcript_20632/g.64685  ORF Transcript_20632/g.64685 Transcript_20632/m.64685 type:complete len:236 (-) Transcript_20632:176-883(-)
MKSQPRRRRLRRWQFPRAGIRTRLPVPLPPRATTRSRALRPARRSWWTTAAGAFAPPAACLGGATAGASTRAPSCLLSGLGARLAPTPRPTRPPSSPRTGVAAWTRRSSARRSSGTPCSPAAAPRWRRRPPPPRDCRATRWPSATARATSSRSAWATAARAWAGRSRAGTSPCPSRAPAAPWAWVPGLAWAAARPTPSRRAAATARTGRLRRRQPAWGSPAAACWATRTPGHPRR